MGEALYKEVVGQDKLARPACIYAPVGTHETLLAYLVRRLLENGANASFANRIGDPNVSIMDLIEDTVDHARALVDRGASHSEILLPEQIFGSERKKSQGFDLSNEMTLDFK
ncbi:hypothetical protein MEG_01894 [Bartonella tamiae Th307]|uniref:Proline dehydrogenase domain-containing protein n=1 Tax=Bartonella tamiae Th239 TaxID=1094558 RepID=J0QU54_9HYPH|nr:hypothetical protein ME5_01962 [Bartonella tamiae Th239]EJF92724.1 hypothetical protein MEG_01894 [Bartonella tamiae Th307]